MTTKAKQESAAKATKAAPAKTADVDETLDAPEPAPGEQFTTAKTPPGVCVVNDGRCVGRAVNGVVCSYHAMTYRADGVRRTP